MNSPRVDWHIGMKPLGACELAMGVFDGVHVGHQALIRECIEGAHRTGVRAGVVTFDRDPDVVVTPDTAASQLLSLEDKLDSIECLGVDFILVIPFDATMASLPPEAFIDEVLLSAASPQVIHVGQDFRFGRFAEGDVDVLRAAGQSRGFRVADRSLVTMNGAPVTSTRIRALVNSGDLTGAARLLGRSHRVRAFVGHGRGAGHELGVPTANLHPLERAALPPEGVYAGRVRLADSTSFAAGISVGRPPTFADAQDELEAHLIDFNGDLYGHTVFVEFIQRLRDQKRFANETDLVTAIQADLEAVRSITGNPS